MKEVLKSMIPKAWLPDAVAGRFLERLRKDDTIRLGPFAGMRFSWEKVFSPPLPKYLGTYEMELMPALEQLFARNFATVIDVGAAEGYYAVGFALKFPQTKVVAFEALEEGQALVKELAVKNDVGSRVEVRGLCEKSDLQEAVTPHTLVMMDVEGAEEFLLDPGEVPALRKATILFESHDALVADVGKHVCARFEGTHNITAVPSRTRTRADWPRAYRWQRYYLKYHITGWMVDRANPTVWYLLEPKVRA